MIINFTFGGCSAGAAKSLHNAESDMIADCANNVNSGDSSLANGTSLGR